MEVAQDYEVTAAAEALRHLSQTKDCSDVLTTHNKEFKPSKDEVLSPATNDSTGTTTPTDNASQTPANVTVSSTPSTSKTGKKKIKKRGLKRKGTDKKSSIKPKYWKGFSLASNLQSVSLAFPVRDYQQRRLLLPKPTDGSNIVTIALPSIISQNSPLHLKRGYSKVISLHKKKKEATYACPSCATKTTTRQALWKHKRRFHSNEPSEVKAERVTCDECDTFSCKTLKELLLHYNSAHGKRLRVHCKEFTSEKDFEEWKKQKEKMYGSWFVLSNGMKVYEHHTTRYYYCNRSGFSRSKGIRMSKRAVKIERKCCAYLRKKRDRETGHITVEYSLDHVGHMTKFGLSNLSEDLSSTITNWHSSRADVDSVFNEICTIATGSEGPVVRSTMDIACHRQCHIPQEQPQRDRLTKFVTDLEGQKDNPILIYKPQGVIENDLSSEDFIIGIQTEFQRELMKKHAGKMVCAHVSQGQDSCLVTVLVIDEDNGGAIPVSWLLASDQDIRLFKPFLEAIKTKCGNIETDLFVTNLSSSLYMVWAETFTNPWRKLDCSWHVDEEWKTYLSSLVTETENQLLVYAYLKTLQYEADEIKFRKILREFMILLEELSPTFKEYFRTDYLAGERCSHWAHCFHKGLNIDVNKLDDALYVMVKEVLSRSVLFPKTYDFILALLLLSHDKALMQFADGKKGYNNHIRKTKVHFLNDAAQSNHYSTGEGTWHVPSEIDSLSEYMVKKLIDSCNCKLRCDTCKVCIHMYTCTCIDFLLGFTACAHIHTIHVMTGKDSLPMTTPLLMTTSNEGMNLVTQIIPLPQTCKNNTNILQLRKEASTKLQDLENIIQNVSDEDVLRKLCTQINAAALMVRGTNLVSDVTSDLMDALRE